MRALLRATDRRRAHLRRLGVFDLGGTPEEREQPAYVAALLGTSLMTFMCSRDSPRRPLRQVVVWRRWTGGVLPAAQPLAPP